MVSFASADQLPVVAGCSESFVLDNGAFSAYRGGKVPDWDKYFEFVERWRLHPGFDWGVMPDSIDGGEEVNNELESIWPFRNGGMPVWHLNESLTRLERMIEQYPRLALGSSGEWSSPCTENWWSRITDVMKVLCDSDRNPRVPFHMLRGLDHRIKAHVPAKSGDSTNIGQNIGKDQNWVGRYQPATKRTRAMVLVDRIESAPSTPVWIPWISQQVQAVVPVVSRQGALFDVNGGNS